MNRNFDEEVIANMLGKVVGDDVMLACFFNNDSTTILKGLLNNCDNTMEVKKMLEQIEYNRKTKSMGSNLGKIQADIIKTFANANNIEDLELNAVTNYDIIGGNARNNMDLEETKKVIAFKKEQFTQSELVRAA